MMNALLGFYKNYSRIEESALPRTEFQKPLPEDYAMRGLTWADRVSPITFFSKEKIDDDEKYVEFPFTAEERKERVCGWDTRLPVRANGYGITRRFMSSALMTTRATRVTRVTRGDREERWKRSGGGEKGVGRKDKGEAANFYSLNATGPAVTH